MTIDIHILIEIATIIAGIISMSGVYFKMKNKVDQMEYRIDLLEKAHTDMKDDVKQILVGINNIEKILAKNEIE